MSSNRPLTHLERARIDRGWTRAQLAAFAGCSESYVAYLEYRERRPRTPVRFRLASALGIAPSDLLRVVDAPRDDAPVPDALETA